MRDDGLLSLDDPVAKFWPEFAANGKGGVLVRHLMSHTSGLSGWDESITAEDLYDHDKCAGLLAAQAPWWEPGTKSGYHAMTQGYLLGELVKRVTGISLGNFFRTRVAEPLNADFHIGTPASVDERVAKVIPAEQALPANIKPESIFARTMLNPAMDARFSWTPEWRRTLLMVRRHHCRSGLVKMLPLSPKQKWVMSYKVWLARPVFVRAPHALFLTSSTQANCKQGIFWSP